MNKNTLIEAFNRLNKDASSGEDKVTKEKYESNLVGNINNLLERLKRGSYKPQPVKRIYIPKDGSDKMRPLGIPILEDLQKETAKGKVKESLKPLIFLGLPTIAEEVEKADLN